RRGELKKELRVAQLQREEAAVAWKQTVLDAGAEVNNALAACQTARERCRLLSAQTLKLREIVEDTKAQMRFAEVNYLQVLLARQNLLSAQLEMVGEEYATLEALSTLFRAVGGGA
ncbi:MAG: TolC family protein, partial [Alloprevotella sp.]